MQNQPDLQQRIRTFLEMVKFSHTIFALPFALMAALLAADGMPSLWKIFWIIIAMAGARTGAMGANRLLDAKFDARNPRTKTRALPAGLIETKQALALTGVSYLIFIFAAAMLNSFCLHLAPYIIMILTAYSLAKRYTDYTHYILGLCLGLAPIGAWIAVTGSLALTPIILGFAVMFWVAGFDLLYSLQDMEFDKEHGLHSIPSKLGAQKTMMIARVFHLLTVLFWMLFALEATLGAWGWLAVGLSAIMLGYEHYLVSRDFTKIDKAFFTVNGYLGFVFILLIIVDTIAR